MRCRNYSDERRLLSWGLEPFAYEWVRDVFSRYSRKRLIARAIRVSFRLTALSMFGHYRSH